MSFFLLHLTIPQIGNYVLKPHIPFSILLDILSLLINLKIHSMFSFTLCTVLVNSSFSELLIMFACMQCERCTMRVTVRNNLFSELCILGSGPASDCSLRRDVIATVHIIRKKVYFVCFVLSRLYFFFQYIFHLNGLIGILSSGANARPYMSIYLHGCVNPLSVRFVKLLNFSATDDDNDVVLINGCCCGFKTRSWQLKTTK